MKMWRISVVLVLFLYTGDVFPSERFFFKPLSTLKENLGDEVANFLNNSQLNIRIAVDQFTDKPTAEILAQREGNIELITGDNESASEKVIGILKTRLGDNNFLQNSSGKNYKMHNKFIVIDNSSIMTGSPNLTPQAYKKNVESALIIQNNQEFSQLYIDYFEEMKVAINNPVGWSPPLGFDIKVRGFNSKSNVKVCFAPLLPLQDFIQEHLKDSKEIYINMFLMSRGDNPSKDLIRALEIQARTGTSITLRVDGNQYDSQKYMKDALQFLKNKKNINILKVYVKKGLFHDKLILIKKKNGAQVVVLGSAGFTTNVQANRNYENMVALYHDETVFNYYMTHFEAVIGTNHPKILRLTGLDE